MKILVSPVFVRMAAVLLAAVAAFLLGIVGLRFLRRQLVEGSEIPEGLGPENASAIFPYSAIIQQLKQQKFALENDQKLQRRRAKTSEHITASMIAHLPCGVLFVTPNGLVRQANAAARQMLGFESPLGMSVVELFRDCKAIHEREAGSTIAEAFQSALRSRTGAMHFESSYLAPSGRERMLKFMVIPTAGPSGEILGVEAVIGDESEAADFRRARVLQSETAAEMALELRTSLATIREWTEQMSATADRDRRHGLSSDVSAETERLEKLVGGFLAERREEQALAAGA